MSGYPVPRYAIGRLRAAIKLNSAEELLKSIKYLADLTNLTAQVIESMDATNPNKYQINRTDILTYIEQLTKSAVDVKLTDEDRDIIAQLITASEANPDNWTLAGMKDGKDSVHAKMYALYRSVLIDGDDGDLPIHDPDTNEIVKLGVLPMFEKAKQKKKKKAENEPDAKPEDANESDHLSNTAVIHRYALCRVIDHIYQLLMDKDTWYAFVPPRKTVDITSNIERAKGLRVFSIYLQSLLTYNQFFGLEMYLQSYEVLQKWIAAFPALETETLNKIEATIRAHDYLNAKADAEQLFKSLSSLADRELACNVFPTEYMSGFGLRKKINAVESVIDQMEFPATIDAMAELNRPQFLPILSGGIVAKFDVAYDLATLLIRNRVVDGVVTSALRGLIPSLTRGSSTSSLTGLKNLNIRCLLPFEIPHTVSYSIMAGADKGITGNKLMLDSGAPDYCYGYHEFLRTNMKFSLALDTAIPAAYPNFELGFIVDDDRAKHLREITERDWRSMKPSFMGSGVRADAGVDICNTIEATKAFIEDMTLDNYEIAIRILTVAADREMLATYFSAFGLLYQVKGDQMEIEQAWAFAEKADPDNTVKRNYELITGYGKPYGATYAGLEALQGPLDPDTRLVPLGFGLYLRFLKFMPVPSFTYSVDAKSWYGDRPLVYFAHNQAKMEITKLVPSEGLWNFALQPIKTNRMVPKTIVTPRYAYPNTHLYINFDALLKPSQPTQAREVIQLPIQETTWSLDRQDFWARYVHFGAYSTAKAGIGDADEAAKVADTIKKIEEEQKKDEREAANSSEGAGTAVKTAATEMKNDADEAAKKAAKKEVDDDELPKI